MKRRILICLLFISIGCLRSIYDISAAAVPSARDIRVDAGTKDSIAIPVKNTATTSAVISLSLMSADFTDGNDQPVLKNLDSRIAPWLSLSKDSLNLISSEQSFVELSVDVPLDTSSQVFAVALVATEISSGQISLSHGSATLVFITIGNELSKGLCKSFLTENFLVTNISIANAGHGILVADGQIVLRGPFGIRFVQTDLNPSHHRILAGQTRSWNTNLPAIPWWAFGSLSYEILDSNIASNECYPIAVGKRWWVVMFLATFAGTTSVILFRTKRS